MASLALFAYRCLLWLYPKPFREEYGRELELAFADQWRQSSSFVDRFCLGINGAAGLLAEAPKEHIDMIQQDVRCTLRLLATNPAFASTVVAVLALGLGSSMTIFGVVEAVMLRPLPYPEPDRLVRLHTRNKPLGVTGGPTSFPDWRDWQGSGILEDSAIYLTTGVIVHGAAGAERVPAMSVSAEFFRVLRVRPLLGRLFDPEEHKPSLTPAVLLGEGIWRRNFNANLSVIGTSVLINGKPATVVGIIPGAFSFETTPDVWTSLEQSEDLASRQNRYWNAFGRLKPGSTLQQVQAAFDGLSQRLERDYSGSNRNWGVDIVPMLEGSLGESRRQLLILSAAVAALLLITCVNVSTLMLVRATARQREIAVRTALGASRSRIGRQLLTESLVLAGLGTLGGLGLATLATRLLVRFGPQDIPRLAQAQIDVRVLVVSAGFALFVGLILGLAPALRSSGFAAHAGLSDTARTTASRRVLRLREVFVVVQFGLAVMLLASAGLLMRSLWNMTKADAGFDPDNLVTFRISLPPAKFLDGERYRKEEVTRYFANVVKALQGVPGVLSAGAGLSLPVGGGGVQMWQRFMVADGGERADQYVHGIYHAVTPDFFPALSMKLRQGRTFTERDGPQAPPVAVINETFARERFGAASPIGRRIRIEGQGPLLEVVGVVGDVRLDRLDAPPPPQIYAPHAQDPRPSMVMAVRASVDSASFRKALGTAVAGVDSDIPLYSMRSGTKLVARSLAQRRMLAILLAVFASLSLLVAATGLGGAIRYMVERRAREFGIRMALGARTEDILWSVLRQGLVLTGAGALMGILAAFGASRFLAGVLFGVGPFDFNIWIGVAVLLALAALVAAGIPARQATSVDPAAALRAE